MQNQELVAKYQKVKQLKSWMIGKAQSSNNDMDSVKKGEEWSILNLLYHLYKVEQSVMDYINYKMEKGELKNKAGFSSWWRSTLLRIMLFLPIKFKAPQKIANFPENIEFNKTIDDWEKAQNKLENFLKNFPKELRGIEVFKHPRSGRITIEQTIDFIIAHLNHHKVQMERLVS